MFYQVVQRREIKQTFDSKLSQEHFCQNCRNRLMYVEAKASDISVVFGTRYILSNRARLLRDRQIGRRHASVDLYVWLAAHTRTWRRNSTKASCRTCACFRAVWNDWNIMQVIIWLSCNIIIGLCAVGIRPVIRRKSVVSVANSPAAEK